MSANALLLVDEKIDLFCTRHSSPPSEVCRLIEEYTRQNVPHSVMLTGPLVGSFLGFLVGLCGARRILEIGCFTGYSALCMAERLADGGELVTLEKEPESLRVAQSFWQQSPHGSKIKPLLGPAQESLAKLRGPFDMVFIDADKTSYTRYLDEALKLLSPSGLIIADNTLYSGKVIAPGNDVNANAILEFDERVKDDASLESVLLPVRDGLYLIRRK